MGAENTRDQQGEHSDFLQFFKHQISLYGSKQDFPTNILVQSICDHLYKYQARQDDKNFNFYRGMIKLFSEIQNHLRQYEQQQNQNIILQFQLQQLQQQLYSQSQPIPNLQMYQQPLQMIPKPPPEEKKPVLGISAQNLDFLLRYNPKFFQETKSVVNLICSENEPQLLKSLHIPSSSILNPQKLQLVKYPEENILLVQNNIALQENCFDSDILLSTCSTTLFVRNPKEINIGQLKERCDTISKYRENEHQNIVVIHKVEGENSMREVQKEIKNEFSEKDLKCFKEGDSTYHIQYRKTVKIYHFYYYLDTKRDFKINLKKILFQELSMHRDLNFGDIFEKKMKSLQKKTNYAHYFSFFGRKNFKNSAYVCQENEYFQEEIGMEKRKQFLLKVKKEGEFKKVRFIKHPFLQPQLYLQVELQSEKGMVTKGMYFDKAQYEGLNFKERKEEGDCLYLLFDFCN